MKLILSIFFLQGRNLQLEGSQIKEYHKLKEKAGKESARYMGELDSINREQKSDQVTFFADKVFTQSGLDPILRTKKDDKNWNSNQDLSYQIILPDFSKSELRLA